MQAAAGVVINKKAPANFYTAAAKFELTYLEARNLLPSTKVKRLDKFVQINNLLWLKQEYRRV